TLAGNDGEIVLWTNGAEDFVLARPALDGQRDGRQAHAYGVQALGGEVGQLLGEGGLVLDYVEPGLGLVVERLAEVLGVGQGRGAGLGANDFAVEVGDGFDGVVVVANHGDGDGR